MNDERIEALARDVGQQIMRYAGRGDDRGATEYAILEIDRAIRTAVKDLTDQATMSMTEVADKALDSLAAVAKEIDQLRAKLEAVQPAREELAEGLDHLTVSGAFRSDKYPWCRVGFVPLKLADPAARDLLSEYARRRGAIDSAFEFDLYEALDRTPAKQSSRGRYEPFETVQDLRGERDALVIVLEDTVGAIERVVKELGRNPEEVPVIMQARAHIAKARKAKP